jgi:serine/threonine protein kinase
LCPSCLFGWVIADGDAAKNVMPISTAAHANPFVPPPPAALAATFPQLELLELVGQGGMGAVYKARQKRLDRFVALKIISPELAGDPTFAERFAREARTLARLSHPNVVAVHDFGEINGLYYFLMEYVDGVNLRQMLQAKQVKPENALALVPQVCAALQYAHDQGIVHRDIKPENILVDRQGRVKIADFGLAKLLGATVASPALTGTGQVMGTPHYMAPEQVEHPLEVDHRADIYSLGVVFYEMLTGELPLGKFPPPSQKATVDSRLDEVVLRTLERDPGGRYQHASEVGTALEEINSLKQQLEEIGEALDSTPQNLLILMGVIACLLLLAWAMLQTKQTYWLFGLPIMLIFAHMIPPRTSAKTIAIVALLTGGIALSFLASFRDCSPLWLLLPVWIWFGNGLWEVVKDENGKTEEENEYEVEGLTPLGEEVWNILWQWDEYASLIVVPDLPAEGLHNARQACNVPPDERILALLDFTDDEDDCSRCLLFGTRALYSDPTSGNGKVLTISYEEFPRRTFVNHGLAVYLGNGQSLKPDLDESPASCEEITELLNALSKAIADFQQRSPTS